MQKSYIVESTDSLTHLEVSIARYLDEGYILAGGVSYNSDKGEYIQAVYHPKSNPEPEEYKKGDMYA